MQVNSLTFVVSLITLLLSAIISYLITRHQKQLEYSFDYRKYILEKRKTAYTNVERVINLLTSSTIETVTFTWIRSFAEGPDDLNPFYHYNIKIIDCLENGYWLSDEILNQIKELHNIMIKMIEDSTPEMGELTYPMTAEKFEPQIKGLVKPLTEIYFKDICELDNIKKFKRKKSFY